MISSSVQHAISLIFAIHVSFIIPLPMMWILLTKPMQKSVTTVCLHCSFARLKNKHNYIEALHVTLYTVNMADCSSPFKRSVITTYHHSLSTV